MLLVPPPLQLILERILAQAPAPAVGSRPPVTLPAGQVDPLFMSIWIPRHRPPAPAVQFASGPTLTLRFLSVFFLHPIFPPRLLVSPSTSSYLRTSRIIPSPTRGQSQPHPAFQGCCLSLVFLSTLVIYIIFCGTGYPGNAQVNKQHHRF